MAQRTIRFVVQQLLERINPMQPEVTWYKLKTGKWGVRVRFQGEAGSEVEVVNKEGKASNVTLTNRIAKFDDAELWEIE